MLVRRQMETEELLLTLLEALGRAPQGEAELLAELEQLRDEYTVGPAAVLTAIAALEAEGLVAVGSTGEPAIYRITPAGTEAVSRRGPTAALRQGKRGGGDPSGDDSATHRPEKVAILFTDLVGSTELFERLGDGPAHRVRRRHFTVLRRTVRRHRGREVKSLGDGLMVAFDTVPGAVTCALAMQAAIESCEDQLQLRIGISHGEAIREDEDYFGRPVIVARRLCDAAPAGDVLVSEPASAPVGLSPAPEVEALGPIPLKGLSKPVSATAIRARAMGA